MEQIVVTHLDGTTLKLQSREKSSTIIKASQTVELLGADIVDITVESAEKMEFFIGDKITIIGRDYTLNTPARERKISECEFVYELQFEGVQYDLLRASYSVNVDTTSNQIQDINGDSLTGDLKKFLDVLISNANRVFPGKWALGTYPAGTETKTETFGETDNCLSVLQNLCALYETEFNIVIDGSGNRTINVGSTGTIHEFTFQYGKGKGIYELTRQKLSTANIITRLYVYGSSRNINTSKYRASKLCLPGKTKSQSFIEDPVAILKYGVWEATKTFEEVFPQRTGTISALGNNELKFIDSSMNFDLNEKEADGITTKYLIPGTPAKIHFNTGNLAGYEFEISEYNAVTKQFTVIPQTDENGHTFPSPSSEAFKFGVGDKYVLIDIYMPQAYIDTAETNLQTKGSGHLGKFSQPRVQYGLTVDSFFLKNIVGADADSNIIWAGDYLPVKDTDLDVDKSIRVKSFVRDLLEDYYYNLTISDLSMSVSTIARVVSELNGIEKLIRINNLNDPARARRNYLNAQEVLNMVFDPEGDFYSDKIKPLSIDTTMLSVGAKSMQFGLVGTIFQPNFGGGAANKNRVVYAGGVLTHYAILDQTDPENPVPRVWNIADGDVTLGNDSAFYIYAKCEREGSGGSILFSSMKIAADSDLSYYHFLIGVINSVGTNNERALALMYGFTTVNGRFIRTGRISSPDGNTYFDLDGGEFKGTFKFGNGTSVETAVSNAQTTASNANSAAITAQTVASSAQSAANSAVTTANNAANAASSAQISAQAANSAIANITSDNILSAAEKPGERSRWNDVAAEKAGLNSQASSFSISTENTAYNNAFQALANYLNNGSAWSSGVPAWLSDANLSVDTAITGSTYRSMWNDYFTARQNLLNAISAKAKTLADNAQSTANTANSAASAAQTAASNAQTAASNAVTAATNAQGDATTALGKIQDIVSENVLDSSEKPNQRERWNIISAEKAGIEAQATTFGITTEKTTYTDAFQTLANYLNNGSTWSSGVPNWLTDANLGTNTAITGSTYRARWQSYYDARTALLNAIAAKAKQLADAAQAAANSAATAAATAQTAANAAKSITDNFTVISGGVTTGNIVQVGSEAAGVAAGMTGVESGTDKVRIWAGSTHANRYSAPFRVLQDGTLYASNANISGTINSSNGVIGGFTISASQLVADSGDNEMLLSSSLLRFNHASNNSWVFLGGDVMPGSLGGAVVCPMRIEVYRTSPYDYGNLSNTGIYFDISGVSEGDSYPISGNHALYIANGDIAGFRMKTRRVGSGTTLSNMDCVILTINSSPMTIYLPSSPLRNQYYMIHRCTASAVTINANGYYISLKDIANKVSSYAIPGWQTFFLHWDAVNSIWWAAITAAV